MWQQIWFVVNCLFVASLIAFLFAQRMLADARREDAHNRPRLARINRGRIALGIASAVLFVLMSASFLINMRVNG
ncbi:hypothetical protein ACFSL6_17345 [Paenibacillus thailandensis]|uniref:DUF2909 domain-containing protein n=1 Tax=Paenibacillus thailandensis TaxID=393250 RepID=A0ABW5QZP2_9BACL